jgi:glucuronokinase
MIIRTRAFARAGLIGNPSDGYHGKTIALAVRNFAAGVVLYESPDLELLPEAQDLSRFESLRDLVNDVQLHGYYGGLRLLKAALKRFAEYCRGNGIDLPDRNFTIRYHSDIPRLVGLAGSSAIITATMRALMRFFEVQIPKERLPALILSVETDELGITAGLQDRVAQVYEGLVYMDFDKTLMASRGYGRYENLDICLLPDLYLAYDVHYAEPTERTHRTVRVLYDQGDPKVVQTIHRIAALTDELRVALEQGDRKRIPELLNRNFDLRSEIFVISEGNRRIIQTARSCGASAKFAGSGGTIIGTYDGPHMLDKLRERLGAIGCNVVLPDVGFSTDEVAL